MQSLYLSSCLMYDQLQYVISFSLIDLINNPYQLEGGMEVFNWIQLVLSTNGDFHIERGNWKQKLNEGVAFVTIGHRVWFKILAAIRDFNETKLKRLDWFTFSLFKWTWSIYLCFGKINARYWVGIHEVGIFLVITH